MAVDRAAASRLGQDIPGRPVGALVAVGQLRLELLREIVMGVLCLAQLVLVGAQLVHDGLQGGPAGAARPVKDCQQRVNRPERVVCQKVQLAALRMKHATGTGLRIRRGHRAEQLGGVGADGLVRPDDDIEVRLELDRVGIHVRGVYVVQVLPVTLKLLGLRAESGGIAPLEQRGDLGPVVGVDQRPDAPHLPEVPVRRVRRRVLSRRVLAGASRDGCRRKYREHQLPRFHAPIVTALESRRKLKPLFGGGAGFRAGGTGSDCARSGAMALLRPARHAALGAMVFATACLSGLRAQVTESPKTIEPGSVLMRMDAISFGLRPDSAAPDQYRALALGTTLVSAGITDSFDVEAGTQLFLRDTFSTAGNSHTESGIGDFTLRTKWTFCRDTSSGQEAAIVPYVMVPVNSSAVGNNFVEGGIIVPWARDIAVGLRAQAMVEWDEFRNVSNTRYDTRWYASAAAQWDLGGRIGAYAEATASLTT